MSGRTRRFWITGLLAATLMAALAPVASAERVRIVRDSHAEPHIQAKSPAGAAYGLAIAQMEDQATYLLENLAAATGRSAELRSRAGVC